MEQASQIESWKSIRKTLTDYLQICGCQRKLKSIISVLSNIHYKINNENKGFTDEEFLICALLHRANLLTHGINCEYPIIKNEEFWDWVLRTKDNANLENN